MGIVRQLCGIYDNKQTQQPALPPAIGTIFVTDYPVQRVLDPSHQLTESDIHEGNLPEQIGLKWKDLARELGFCQGIIDIIENEKLFKIKECCIEILVRWMHQNGTEATVGKLKESLEKVELKNVADNLISGKQEMFFTLEYVVKLDSQILL